MEVCRKMQGDRIISALIGLVGAMSNNGKTERTDSVVREAFLRLTDGDSEEETVQKIHAEKFAIAPDCATCLNPCGNTSDCDMSQFYAADAKIIAAKRDLIEAICKKMSSSEIIPETVYQGIAYLGYDLEPICDPMEMKQGFSSGCHDFCSRFADGVAERFRR